jgi:glutaredoxin 3
MNNNIINFLTQNAVLSIGLIVAVVGYILFEVVWWFGGGSLEYQSKVTLNQLVSLFNHNNALIIDIRLPEVYQVGHIVDSINIAPKDCNDQNAVIKSNLNRPIVIVCETGKNGAVVAANLRKRGVKEVFYLAGGLAAWQASNMPLTATTSKSKINDYKSKVVIYTKESCAYCLGAKNLLRNKGVQYKEITPSVDSPEFKEMVKLSNGLKTMPQIFIDGQHIGGFDSLKELNDNGKLDDILRSI